MSSSTDAEADALNRVLLLPEAEALKAAEADADSFTLSAIASTSAYCC
tara:strand:+ start:380 stop:523 length:144 start_codon:yes stop_codon:yes gene_type:complete